jgi:hypothetical protein
MAAQVIKLVVFVLFIIYIYVCVCVCVCVCVYLNNIIFDLTGRIFKLTVYISISQPFWYHGPALNLTDAADPLPELFHTFLFNTTD